MSRIPTINSSEAAPKAQQLLAAVQAKLGMTPNMMKTMAHSPAVLEGYLSLSGALSKGKLPAALGERIALTVAQVNSCEYCLSAHSAIGKMVGLKPEQIEESRRATASDAKTAAVLHFAQRLTLERGQIDDASLAAVRAAGLSDAEIAEIVAHVALNILTNYFNNVAGTEVDFPRVTLALTA